MTDTQLSSAEELRARLAADRAGLPYIVYRDATSAQCLLTLRDELDVVTVGRAAGCLLHLELDPEVSRLHAELRHLGEDWVVCDDGLSRNGSYRNDTRIAGRQRLCDGDVLRFGQSVVSFHDPFRSPHAATRTAAAGGAAALSETQRRVLVALCRPLRDRDRYALPASNQAIAEELFLSVGAVKGHLRVLFEKLDVEQLPHNQKRLRLVEQALQAGLIRPSELH